MLRTTEQNLQKIKDKGKGKNKKDSKSKIKPNPKYVLEWLKNASDSIAMRTYIGKESIKFI